MISAIFYLKKWTKAGGKPSYTAELNQQIFIANIFVLIGSGLTLIMGGVSLYRQDWLLASALIITSLLFFSSHLICGWLGDSVTYDVNVLFGIHRRG